jgi:hypothetical protein
MQDFRLVTSAAMNFETDHAPGPVVLRFHRDCGYLRHRAILTRASRSIVDHFDGRIKLCFRSEEYANAFARLNGCGLD